MKNILGLCCLVHFIYVSSCKAKTGSTETETKNRDETIVNSAKDRPRSTTDTRSFDPVKKVFLASKNFSEVRHSTAFVDKTLWIKDYWEKSKPFIYIMAPPRFGKSVLMNTAMEFFNAVEDINHRQQKPNGPSVRDMFMGTKLFDEERYFFDDHYHKYIVMYFHFRSLADVNDYESFKKIFCGIICDMRERVHPEAIKTGSRIDGLKKCQKDCTRNFYLESNHLGQRLSNFLHSVYGKPVIVFIDDFDAFVYALLAKKILESDAQRIVSHLTSYLSPLLKGNDFVERCYATGSLSLGGLLSTRAANLKPITFDSSEMYAKYFGLTDAEVQSLLGNFGLSHSLSQVREFYGGYEVNDSDLEIYNTISVLKFLESGGKLDYYWVHAVQPLTDYSAFFSHPFIGKEILTVVIGDSISSSPHQLSRATLNKWQKLSENLLSGEVGGSRHMESLFIYYLEESGYLTRSRDTTRFKLRAANEETRFALEYVLVRRSSYFEKQRKISLEHQVNLVNAVAPLSVVGSLSVVDSEKAMLRLAKALHEMFSQDCSGVTDERVTFVGPIYAALRSEMTDGQIFTSVSAKELGNATGLNPETPVDSGKVDMTILFADGGVSMWECSRGKTASMGMNQLFDQKYPALFNQKFKGNVTKPISYLAINIDRRCRVTLKYTVGSTNEKDAKEVAYPEEKRTKEKNGEKSLHSC